MSQQQLLKLKHELNHKIQTTTCLDSASLIDCFTPIRWTGHQLLLIDQRLLPVKEVEVLCQSWQETAQAIKDMVVRGAPAIGITAAYGLI